MVFGTCGFCLVSHQAVLVGQGGVAVIFLGDLIFPARGFCGIWSVGVSLIVLCDNGSCAWSMFRHRRFFSCQCIYEPLSLNKQIFVLVFSTFLSLLVSPDGTWGEHENVTGTKPSCWNFDGLGFVEFLGRWGSGVLGGGLLWLCFQLTGVLQWVVGWGLGVLRVVSDSVVWY